MLTTPVREPTRWGRPRDWSPMAAAAAGGGPSSVALWDGKLAGVFFDVFFCCFLWLYIYMVVLCLCVFFF